MKIAFKNFLMTLRRYKVASLLNVVGLTLAFVAFYIIASQVWFTTDQSRIPTAYILSQPSGALQRWARRSRGRSTAHSQ